MNIKHGFIYACVAALLTACTHKVERPAVDLADFAHIAAANQLTHDQQSLACAEEYAADHRSEFDAMCMIIGLPDTTDMVMKWLEQPIVKVFAADIDTISPSTRALTDMLSHIVAESNANNLRLPASRFVATIWGRPQSIIFSDSTMLIALNHYLGSEHPAYSSLPSYRRYDKSPEVLPYDVVEAMVATAYPWDSDRNSTLINKLIYEGLLIETKMRLVEKPQLNIALGYTPDQLKWLEDNETNIWNKMTGEKMLFDSSEGLAATMIAPAPFTAVISQEAPGRIGRYIGYKIVKAYLDAHDQMPLDQLLESDFIYSRNPLLEANYNPLR